MRTYMVVPTNETNGLIEWVGNLKGLRPIIINLMKVGTISLQLFRSFSLTSTIGGLESRGLSPCF